MIRLARRTGAAIFTALLLVFSLGPFYYMAIGSLKEGDEQVIRGNPWWVGAPIFDNYRDLLADPNFGRWVLNTLLVIGATLLISVVACVLAAYALTYLRVPFGRGIVLGLFLTYLLPQAVLFVPLIVMLSRLHLLNSPLALILTYPSLVIPFGTWTMWSFFHEVPRDLVDLARVEGAGLLTTLGRILLPLAAPSLAAVGLFTVAIVFNDFLYAFTFITRTDRLTLMGAVGTTNVDVNDISTLFAASLLGTAPAAFICAWLADRYATRVASGVLAA